MGFWQGFNQGITIVKEEKARKKELEAQQQEAQTERDLRTKERAEDRAFQREQYLLQLEESRRDALFPLLAQRKQEEAEASALTGKASMFLSRFEGIEDSRLATLASDPVTAAELEDKATEIAKYRAEYDLPPLQGEVLLDLLTVQDRQTGAVTPVDLSVEDLLQLDVSDRTQYEAARLALSQPTPRVAAAISPEAYRRPDPKALEEGRKLFDREVLAQATAKLNSLSPDAPEWSSLNAQIEQYSTENSPGRFALQETFGPTVALSLIQMNNPYIQKLKDDPQLYTYVYSASEIDTLTRIAEDATAPEEQRQEARNLLNEKYGL